MILPLAFELLLNLVVVVGPSRPPLQDSLNAFTFTQSTWPEAHLKLKNVYRIQDTGQKDPLKDYVPRLHRWRYMLATKYKLRFHPSKAILHMFLPPVYQDGRDFGGGVAAAVCGIKSRYAYSYSVIRLTNIDGHDRRLFSYTSCAHELGHVIGAAHVSNPPCTLMDTNGLACTLPLPVANISHDQVNDCLMDIK